MNALATLALKELRDGLRNRWIASTILSLAALGLALALLGAAPTGQLQASSLSVTVVSLTALGLYLVPLIALMLSYDAVVGEDERGTLGLLLSYPLARWQVLAGKFAGHLALLALAIVLGFGCAAAAAALAGGADAAGWRAFAALCGSAVLLGASFLALGYLLSTLFEERMQVLGIAIGVWLLLVVVYDFALLGLLLLDESHAVGERLFSALLLLNPTDAFRVFNMTQFEAARQVGGLAGLAQQAAPSAILPLASLVAWTTAALALATLRFLRKEV